MGENWMHTIFRTDVKGMNVRQSIGVKVAHRKLTVVKVRVLGTQFNKTKKGF